MVSQALQPFFRQLFFEIVARDQHHIGNRGEFWRLCAFGHPVVEHFTGFITMDIRAWQQRAVEAGRLGFRQFVHRIDTINTDANHVWSFKALPFGCAHAAKDGVVIHAHDQPVFHLRMLNQH